MKAEDWRARYADPGRLLWRVHCLADIRKAGHRGAAGPDHQAQHRLAPGLSVLQGAIQCNAKQNLPPSSHPTSRISQDGTEALPPVTGYKKRLLEEAVVDLAKA